MCESFLARKSKPCHPALNRAACVIFPVTCRAAEGMADAEWDPSLGHAAAAVVWLSAEASRRTFVPPRSATGGTRSAGIGSLRTWLAGLILAVQCCLSVPNGRAQPSGSGQLVPVPGRPFAAVAAPSGAVFVSLSGRGAGAGAGAVAVLRRGSDTLAFDHVAEIGGIPGELVLSHDGRHLAVAAGRATVLLDAAHLAANDGDPVVGRFGDEQGAIGVAFSPDDRILAVSEERASRLSLIELSKPEHVLHLSVGQAPVGMAFSSDGHWLYVTSEVDPGFGPATCRAETGNGTVAEGTVATVDLQALGGPAIVARAAVGCGPVRIVLARDSAWALVSLRTTGTVAVFATAALRAGLSLPIAIAAVGPSPVGMALAAGGRTLLVANSNRFERGSPGSLSCLQLGDGDPTLNAVTVIPTGVFPREVTVLPDGTTFLVTLFGSRALQLLSTSCQP